MESSLITKAQIETKTKTITFLTLPLELRWQIYRYVLIRRQEEDSCNPYERQIKKGKKRPIPLTYHGIRYWKTNMPQIHVVCKQLEAEIDQFILSENIWSLSGSSSVHKLPKLIGLPALQHLKSLEIFVDRKKETRNTWTKFFDTLAKIAPNLRHVSIEFDADSRPGRWFSGFSAKHPDNWDYSLKGTNKSGNRGYGDKVSWIRAFAKLKGLERVWLRGFYAKNWPEYIEKTMGVKNVTGWGPEGLSERELALFEAYQKGTEALYP